MKFPPGTRVVLSSTPDHVILPFNGECGVVVSEYPGYGPPESDDLRVVLLDNPVWGNRYWYTRVDTLSEQPASPATEKNQEPQKENPMDEIIKVEQKTFVNGQDIANLENGVVVNLISQGAKAIAELKKLEPMPKCVAKEIEKREAGLKALVEALDARPTK